MVRIRQHVNPLKSFFLDREVELLELPPGRDVEVELGCADARFLFARAELLPDIVPIGLEIRAELVEEVNEIARRLGSPVRVLFSHANHDFPRLFQAGSLARIFVNFPDPWFKRRHRKRRVIDGPLVADMTDALRDGGELFFQSDVWDVALDALAAFEDEPRLQNAAGPWTFWKDGNPYAVKSRREEQCEGEGAPIWRLLYRVVSSPRAAASRAP